MPDPAPSDPPDGLTLPSVQRSFVEWHRSRARFAVWGVAIADPRVEARLARVCEALQPWLLPGYRRQAHVTLQVCGFVVPSAEADDDFGPAQQAAQVAAAGRLRLAPFELRIGGAFSFRSAACLSVQDPSGSLTRLRAAGSPALRIDDPTPYVPHVTAGLYGGAWPMREVQQRLQPLADLPPIALTVDALDWMAYDSAVIGGPLHGLQRLALGPVSSG